MRLNKTMSILAIFVMVIAVGTPSGLVANNYNNGHNVDTIYQSIRNAGPVYEWDDEIVYLENKGMTMICTLTIPRTQHLCPIVITMNGFTGTRDESPVGEIPGNEGMLKRNARILAEQGFASLRIGFRGQDEDGSGGEYQVTTFSGQISDALAAVDYIENNLKHRVDTKSIGMLGFSQGGLVGSAAAARDKRVDSLVLWSPATLPPHEYEGLITKEGILAGLALPDVGWDMFPLSLNGQYIGIDVPLGKGFFEDLFKINPVGEITKYKNPLMVIVGTDDYIVWPQPAKGQMYMTYHNGPEHLVNLNNADHAFNYWEGPEPEKLDDAIYWGIAWFIKTLK